MSEKQRLCKCAYSISFLQDYIDLAEDLVSDVRKKEIAIAALGLALARARKSEKECKIDLSPVIKGLEQARTDVFNANTEKAKREVFMSRTNLSIELVDCSEGRK